MHGYFSTKQYFIFKCLLYFALIVSMMPAGFSSRKKSYKKLTGNLFSRDDVGGGVPHTDLKGNLYGYKYTYYCTFMGVLLSKMCVQTKYLRMYAKIFCRNMRPD